MKKRLQKFLAGAGVASRRKCEEYISQGRVSVNGAVTTQMGQVVDDDADSVEVDGVSIRIAEEKIYLIMNKPANILTSCSDDRGRKTVLDILPDMKARVFPVGRLDYDTEGLLILTNDGELAQSVSHPSHNISKTYLAVLNAHLNDQEISDLENGVFIDGRLTSKAKVLVAGEKPPTYTIEIHEGRNRQVKKMFACVGKKVLYLKRIAIGEITLGNMQPGQVRPMTDTEIMYFKSHGKK